MTIQYAVTADDVLRFTHHVLARPAFRRQYLLGFAVGPIFGVLLVLRSGAGALAAGVLKGLVLAVAISLLYAWLYRRQVTSNTKRAYAGDGGPLGPKTMTVTSEGVQELGAHSVVSHKWSGIESVEETEEAIYLNVTGGSGYVVPMGAFTGGATTKAEFLAAVMRFRSEAQQ